MPSSPATLGTIGRFRPIDKRQVVVAMHITDLRLHTSAPQNSWSNTSLGNELELDLIEVFLGYFDEFEAVEILEGRGLLFDRDVPEVWAKLGAIPADARYLDEVDRILRPIVQKAYRAHYNLTGRLV